MRIDPSWGVSFKIALHVLFLCIGIAWACSNSSLGCVERRGA